MLSCSCILQGLDTDTKIHFGGENKNKKEIVTTMFRMACSFFSKSFLSSRLIAHSLMANTAFYFLKKRVINQLKDARSPRNKANTAYSLKATQRSGRPNNGK